MKPKEKLVKKLLIIRYSLFVALFVALGACSESENKIQCGDYQISYVLADKTLDTVINGDKVALQQTESASGVRYSGVLNDTKITIWNKGKDWTLYLNDGDSIDCK